MMKGIRFALFCKRSVTLKHNTTFILRFDIQSYPRLTRGFSAKRPENKVTSSAQSSVRREQKEKDSKATHKASVSKERIITNPNPAEPKSKTSKSSSYLPMDFINIVGVDPSKEEMIEEEFSLSEDVHDGSERLDSYDSLLKKKNELFSKNDREEDLEEKLKGKIKSNNFLKTGSMMGKEDCQVEGEEFIDLDTQINVSDEEVAD